MTEQEMADATYGKGWSSKVERDLHDLKESSKRVEGKIARFIDRQTDQFESDRKWKVRTEKRLESLEADDDEDEEITGVQSRSELLQKGRGLRARNRRMKRTAKIIAPALVGVGIALAEIIREVVKVLH